MVVHVMLGTSDEIALWASDGVSDFGNLVSESDGKRLGSCEGTSVGRELCPSVGIRLGDSDLSGVSNNEGTSDGKSELRILGCTEALSEVRALIVTVGNKLGTSDGIELDKSDDASAGWEVGTSTDAGLGNKDEESNGSILGESDSFELLVGSEGNWRIMER
jgi:hypothetical protein